MTQKRLFKKETKTKIHQKKYVLQMTLMLIIIEGVETILCQRRKSGGDLQEKHRRKSFAEEAKRIPKRNYMMNSRTQINVEKTKLKRFRNQL